MRRIVVTGLGAVTPLGVGMSAQYQMRNQVVTATADGNPGVKRTWNRLLDGETGIAALTHQKYAGLPCRVAATVPKGLGTGGGWTAGEWLAAGVCVHLFLGLSLPSRVAVVFLSVSGCFLLAVYGHKPYINGMGWADCGRLIGGPPHGNLHPIRHSRRPGSPG
jgi:hypothetical protein